LTAKGRATRARIIDAAAQLTYENGAANTSFEDVRKAAKASGSQMSHYFADKRSLIRAVIAHQADAVIADHHDPAIGNLDSIAALRAWAQRIVEQQRAQNFEGGCRLGSLAAELVESDAELQADFAAGFERWEALSRRGLLTMQQRGDLGPDADPDALAYSCSLLRRADIYSRSRIETHTLLKPRSVPRSTTSNRLRSRPASALPDIWVQWGALAVSS
jgi:TetR/AcrR family transcriptional regulator, transcriptional repressor for nem operon